MQFSNKLTIIKYLLSGAIALIFLGSLGCQTRKPDAKTHQNLFSGIGEGEICAEVGDFEIRSDRMLDLYHSLPDTVQNTYNLERFAYEYTSQKILVLEALEQKLYEDPSTLARLELAWNDILSQSYIAYTKRAEVSEKLLRDYYERNKDAFLQPPSVRLRHILASPEKDVPLFNKLGDDAVSDSQARSKINKLLKRLKTGESFEELASNYSEDNSAAKGGDLGWIGPGDTLASFEQAAFALENPGDITEVVQTAYGYHIIELVEKKESAFMPFDQAKLKILDTLQPNTPQERDSHTAQMIELLKHKYPVSIHEDKLPTP